MSAFFINLRTVQVLQIINNHFQNMPKDQEFLRVLFSENQSSMRFRSSTEYKLLQAFMVVVPVTIAAVVGLNDVVTNEALYIVMTGSLALLLTAFTIVITMKINAEHKIYEEIGAQNVRIWEYFELFDKGVYLEDKSILDEGARRYGTGQGHKKTINILWVVTILVDFILVLAGIIKTL